MIEIATGRFPIPALDPEPPLVSIHAPAVQADHSNSSKDPSMAIFELLAHIVDGPAPKCDLAST